MSTSLERRLPPVNVAWLYLNPDHNNAQGPALENVIAQYRANDPHYLDDVVTVAARYRAKRATANYVLPTADTHVANMTDTDLDKLAHRIVHSAYNRDATSLFVYACQLRLPPAKEYMSAEPYAVNVVHDIMKGFAADCKFKTTNDLFIHTIIRLKLPAWLSTGLCANETPYAAAARVFGTSTNDVVRPLVQTSAEALLLAVDRHDRFCILAAMAIEMTNAVPCIVVNTMLLTVPADQPTLAVVHNVWDTDVAEIGYVHNTVFYTHTDPYVVIAAWTVACDASSSFGQAAAGNEMFENPLRKYMP